MRQAVRRINKMAQRELQARLHCGGGSVRAGVWVLTAGMPLGLWSVWAGMSPIRPVLTSLCVRLPTHPPTLRQEMFQRVYGVRSSSNNNLWLRKKLIEAVNTRPRGGSGSGSDRTYQPRHQDREPAAYVGAAAAAAGEDTARRRRKKSAPTRASDGVQVRAGRAPFSHDK